MTVCELRNFEPQQLHCSASLASGVEVSFTEAGYTVQERDHQVDVCVSLNGTAEVPVSVVLALEQNEQVSPEMRATREKCTRVHSHMHILRLFLCSWI